MKNTWKYILIGLGVVIVEWIFLAVFIELFNGLGQTEGVVIGAAFFLAFEMVICTGVVISKIEQTKEKSGNDSASNNQENQC